MKSPTTAASPIPAEYRKAHGYLQVIVSLVAIYGSAMTVAGRAAALPLFNALHFGPDSKNLNDEAVSYSIFAFGVLGAVLVGWMVLMYFVLYYLAIHPDATVRALARKALALSTISWFLLDTGFSIAVGELEHAAFNIPFVSGLAIPLYVMNASDVADPKKGK